MADKKTTKLSAKSVAKDFAKTAEDLRKLSVIELNEALATAKADLQNARKMLSANELPNTNVVKKSRKFVAKIHTILTEKVVKGETKVDAAIKDSDKKITKTIKGKEQK